jgi:hypothetical protein
MGSRLRIDCCRKAGRLSGFLFPPLLRNHKPNGHSFDLPSLFTSFAQTFRDRYLFRNAHCDLGLEYAGIMSRSLLPNLLTPFS